MKVVSAFIYIAAPCLGFIRRAAPKTVIKIRGAALVATHITIVARKYVSAEIFF